MVSRETGAILFHVKHGSFSSDRRDTTPGVAPGYDSRAPGADFIQ